MTDLGPQCLSVAVHGLEIVTARIVRRNFPNAFIYNIPAFADFVNAPTPACAPSGPHVLTLMGFKYISKILFWKYWHAQQSPAMPSAVDPAL